MSKAPDSHCSLNWLRSRTRRLTGLFFIAWYSAIRNAIPMRRDSPRTNAALALVENIANDPGFHIGMRFEPGDIQLLNNSTVILREDHGRRRPRTATSFAAAVADRRHRYNA